MWLSLVLENPIASALMLGCVFWWAFDLRLPPARELARRLGRATGRLLKLCGMIDKKIIDLR